MNSRTLALLTLALCACRGNSHDEDADYVSSSGARAGESSGVHATEAGGKSTGVSASTASAAPPAVTAGDREFVEKAAVGGRFEVESSELALSKGVSGSLRDFAEMMVADHSKANAELTQLAKSKALQPPAKLDAKHQQDLDKLSALSGEEFERTYREMQTQAHEDAIRLFEKATAECKDADLREFAQRTLPTLRKHREHITAAG
jgi:putative membrane protein